MRGIERERERLRKLGGQLIHSQRILQIYDVCCGIGNHTKMIFEKNEIYVILKEDFQSYARILKSQTCTLHNITVYIMYRVYIYIVHI